MKTCSMILLLFIICGILCGGCTTIFQADFNKDASDSPPNLSPMGNPTNDSILIQGNADTAIVIDSAVLNSRALTVVRQSNTVYNRVDCITGGTVSYNTGYYTVVLQTYRLGTTGKSQSTIAVHSTSGKALAILLFDQGNLKLKSSSGNYTMIGSYDANQVQLIIIGVDMSNRNIDLSITRQGASAINLEDEPFLDNSAEDLKLVRFELPQTIVEALPGTIVVDDVIISKKK